MRSSASRSTVRSTPSRLEPAATDRVSTEDAYGNGPVERLILALRGLVRPGNSGGPLVSRSGAVLGTVFAAVTGGAPGGGFAVPDVLVAHELAVARGHGTPVGTGACTG